MTVRALQKSCVRLTARGVAGEILSNHQRRQISPILFADRLVHVSPGRCVTSFCRTWRGPGQNGCLYDLNGTRDRIQTKNKRSYASSPEPSANSRQGNEISQKIEGAVSASQTPSSAAKNKRKTKRKKSQFSPINKNTINHPKNTSPPIRASITRKQFLRLSPKQRANLKRYLLEERKSSRTILDEARRNARSNLRYLKGTAETNLKKNIQTIKRLFRGEDVWKDEPGIESSKGTNVPSQNQESLQWKKLPKAIQANLKNNLSTLQNFLHKVTDGAIPSPNIATAEASAGSVATRIQKFHEMKTDKPLVMDNYWITWNILLALTPGFLIQLYCWSVQDEMKAYYGDLEKRERERLLGAAANSRGLGSSRDEEGSRGMGLSSTLVIEGAGTWDRIKMAMNDLFLGGVDENVKMVSGAEDDSKLDEVKERPAIAAPLPKASNPFDVETDGNTKDATIETLLKRIQALEKQVEIQQQPKQNAKYQFEHMKESPIQKRRDEYMISRWKQRDEEEEQAKESKYIESFTFRTIIDTLKSATDFDGSFLKELSKDKFEELAKYLQFDVSVDESKPRLAVGSESMNTTVTSSDVKTATVQEARTIESEDAVNDEPCQPDETDSETTSKEAIQSQSRWRRWWSKITWRRQHGS